MRMRLWGACRGRVRSRGPAGATGYGATKLGECTLEALALLVELGKPLLDKVKGLVEYVAGARHFLPFIPSALCLPGRQLLRSVAESQ